MGRETEALCWGSELSIGFNARVEPVQKKATFRESAVLCSSHQKGNKGTRNSHTSFSTHPADGTQDLVRDQTAMFSSLYYKLGLYIRSASFFFVASFFALVQVINWNNGSRINTLLG